MRENPPQARHLAYNQGCQDPTTSQRSPPPHGCHRDHRRDLRQLVIVMPPIFGERVHRVARGLQRRVDEREHDHRDREGPVYCGGCCSGSAGRQHTDQEGEIEQRVGGFQGEHRDAWIQAADTYQSMWGGMGSLTDLYIYGEDAEAIGDEYGELVKALNPFFERATCA